MKYTPNAMKFDPQSRSSLLILNMKFENCGSWLEIKNVGRFGLKFSMCSNFYKTWHLVQIEHANYEYNTPHGLGRLRDYWLSMIIGCKIRLTFRTWLIALTPR